MSENICVVFAPGRSASTRHHVYHHLASFEGQSVQCYALLDERPDYLDAGSLENEFRSFCDRFDVRHVVMTCLNEPQSTEQLDRLESDSVEFLLTGGNTYALLTWHSYAVGIGLKTTFTLETEFNHQLSIEEWAIAHQLEVSQSGNITSLTGIHGTIELKNATILQNDPTRVVGIIEIFEIQKSKNIRESAKVEKAGHRRHAAMDVGEKLALFGLHRSVRVWLSFPNSIDAKKKVRIENDGQFIGDRRKWLMGYLSPHAITSSDSTTPSKHREFFRICEKSVVNAGQQEAFVMAYDRRNPHRSNHLLARGFNWLRESTAKGRRTMFVYDLPQFMESSDGLFDVNLVQGLEPTEVESATLVLDGMNGSILRRIYAELFPPNSPIHPTDAFDFPSLPTLEQTVICQTSNMRDAEITLESLALGRSKTLDNIQESSNRAKNSVLEPQPVSLQSKLIKKGDKNRCFDPENRFSHRFVGRLGQDVTNHSANVDLDANLAVEALFFHAMVRSSDFDCIALEHYKAVDACKKTGIPRSMCICGRQESKLGWHALTPEMYAFFEGITLAVDVKYFPKFTDRHVDYLMNLRKYVMNIGSPARVVAFLVTARLDQKQQRLLARVKSESRAWLDIVHITDKAFLNFSRLDDLTTEFVEQLRESWKQSVNKIVHSSDVVGTVEGYHSSHSIEKKPEVYDLEKEPVVYDLEQVREVYTRALEDVQQDDGRVFLPNLGTSLIKTAGGAEELKRMHGEFKLNNKNLRTRMVFLGIQFVNVEGDSQYIFTI
jgi:hypothetical protein